MQNSTHSHFVFIDLLKAFAAQLIVLHHLALYGPIVDYVRPALPAFLPALFDWLEGDARMAVQIFLVIGGFLAARSLAAKSMSASWNPLRLIGRRFLKLVPPFVVAMLLAIAASALARQWMTHDSIGSPATLAQLAAHALLLHSLLDVESLSAGAWYVAIDFQLYAVLVLLVWLVKGSSVWIVCGMVGIGVAASLFHFNRDTNWDVWAPYFFGSYGLGALAWWGSALRGHNMRSMLIISGMLLIGGLALEVDFRERIAIALATALLLTVVYRNMLPSLTAHPRRDALISWLGRTSYALFLVHFPVCLVVNAIFERFMPHTVQVQVIGMLLGWGLSMIVSAAFYRWVELPLGRLQSATGRRRAISTQVGSW